MESCANVFIIIVWAFVYRQTTFATLTINMIWYYLILPHIFLMNSSHNKDLIVDQGWKTTIRNALSLPVAFRLKNSIRNSNQNQFLYSSKKEDPSRIFTIDNSSISYEDRPEVCNISIDRQNSPASFVNKTDINSNNAQIPTLTKTSSTDTTISENIRHNQGNRLYISEQILRRMSESVMTESSYLHYFRELLRLEETLDVEGNSGDGFEIVEFDQLPKMKIEKVKSRNLERQQNDLIVEYKNKSFNNNEKLEPMTNLLLSQSERMSIRLTTIKDFQVYCTNDDVYNNFLNIVIDLEEKFIR